MESDVHGQGLGVGGVIYTGGNGGYQAINLAYFLGARKIILLGYDMQRSQNKSHWHGDHPSALNRSCNFKTWLKNYKDLARDLRGAGVACVNASRNTALDCFQKVTLEEALT